jgi:hypothetical protein
MELPVYIRYRKRRFHAARARELSSVGMTLAVQSLTLPTGTPIELEFRGPGRTWLIAAAVTHSDNSGVGVMFRDPQPALLASIEYRVSSIEYRVSSIEYRVSRPAGPSKLLMVQPD